MVRPNTTFQSLSAAGFQIGFDDAQLRGVRVMAAVRGEKLLTASDLATLCEVDLKTIHNWVDRGRIVHFRTPGRHLRFRAADVAGFLRAWGYDVPRELARASMRSGLVAGSKETMAHVARVLGDEIPLREVKHPYDALVMAGADRPDLFIVDANWVANEVDLEQWLEALNRSCPDARCVVLTDESSMAQSFVTPIGRSDGAALRALLLPETPMVAARSAASAGDAQPITAQVGEGLARAVGSC